MDSRPLTKTILKQSLLGGDRLRTHAARLAEALADLMAEVRAEVAQELDAKTRAGSNTLNAATADTAQRARDKDKKVVS